MENANTLVINKQFIEQNHGEMEVEGINVVKENIDVQQGIISGDININNNNQQRTRTASNDDYMTVIEHTLTTGSNELFNSAVVALNIEKLNADTLILSPKQLTLTEIQTIEQELQNENPLIQTQIATVSDAEQNETTFTSYYYDANNPSLNVQPTRDGTLAAIGSWLLLKISQCMTTQVGGRYQMNQRGFWIVKKGDKVYFIDNTDAVQDPFVELAPGDCYFYIGSTVELHQIGLSDYTFSACLDSNWNICFNTPFGGWSISPWESLSLLFVQICEKIWKWWSNRNTSNDQRHLLTGTPLLPGLTYIPDNEIKEMDTK